MYVFLCGISIEIDRSRHTPRESGHDASVFVHLFVYQKSTYMLTLLGLIDVTSPLLDEKEVHGGVGENDEDNTKGAEADDVGPQGVVVETKGAQDGGTRDGDV